MFRRLFSPVAAALLLLGCTRPPGETVTVYGAASTREALTELAAAYRAETGTPLALNFGPSSTLARQIEQGGDADLFLSADEHWADYLAERRLEAGRWVLLTNRLVVVVPAESNLQVPDLGTLGSPEVKRLALAGAAVPAGRYAREALTKAGVWDQVRGRVLEGGDVRAALTYVARGEAEAGIVYATDARADPQVRVVYEVPAGLHTPIRYPLVLVARPAVKPAARAFADYLRSSAAADQFRAWGFGVEGERVP